jgi:hypothetical protein
MMVVVYIPTSSRPSTFALNVPLLSPYYTVALIFSKATRTLLLLPSPNPPSPLEFPPFWFFYYRFHPYICSFILIPSPHRKRKNKKINSPW